MIAVTLRDARRMNGNFAEGQRCVVDGGKPDIAMFLSSIVDFNFWLMSAPIRRRIAGTLCAFCDFTQIEGPFATNTRRS